jgi:coenzyme F420-reducing hydrogenase gamma subunit
MESGARLEPPGGGGLGGGVAAILFELAGLLERLVEAESPGAIDLRSLPMSPLDRAELLRVLGEGEVQATVNAQGLSMLRETRVPGVWWVEHFDQRGELIAELIDVSRVPQLLTCASDEIAAGARALARAISRRGPRRGMRSPMNLTVARGAARPRHQPARLHQVLHGHRIGHGAAAVDGRGHGRAVAPRARPSVVYLSFQECTGCFESLTRSFAPTIESLIFNVISLDYDDTLMAAAGEAAESALAKAMKDNFGKYVLVIDGSVPTGAGGAYCTSGGRSAVDTLREAAKGAAAIVCVGTCSSFGGIPFADPNPTGAWPVTAIVGDKPIINVSGCPPIPEVITGTLLQFVSTGQVPDLDEHRRPKAFFGNTIHDRCYRRPFYDEGQIRQILRR